MNDVLRGGCLVLLSGFYSVSWPMEAAADVYVVLVDSPYFDIYTWRMMSLIISYTPYPVIADV